ncbi:MAG: bifunctional diaminohydroxyphosphoribosylaminopyrimidine deaminase/5-amino-6-(5-phosphoribosylamino)uracil reductase RibD [Pirellulales bacterium]|nr:bifunctional diaminohydroxyphosphoribosylaminopyrimidine deaminase/5-amino-6-(5-phosphoribosylamino)uracil reductase RibD [Pirellulales bacterium]
MPDTTDHLYMSRALELARQGRGFVEPNPMVGCVLVLGDTIVGEGWHQRFGGPHAEVAALTAAGAAARGATAYVTLEPCCHTGKTLPCSGALIDAGVAKVVVGCRDPNPQVAGGGLEQLRASGIEIVEGVLAGEAVRLIAPFVKLLIRKRPWVIAKWAMTLDGKLASRTGKSRWITGEASRALVHQLRGQVDAVLVGRGTASADDPLLTARPPGPRSATRIVLDSHASLSLQSKLMSTIEGAPVLVAVAAGAPQDRCDALAERGAEVLVVPGNDRAARLESLLDELGKRHMTNLLVEGGAEVLGTFLDRQEIDEVHAFVAPKLIGGEDAPSAIAGKGLAEMSAALDLQRVTYETLGEDLHIHGYVSLENDDGE